MGEGDGKNGVWALRDGRLLPTLMITTTGTKKAANIFSNPQHAQFLAAAASVASIPKLDGVTEVNEGDCILRGRVF